MTVAYRLKEAMRIKGISQSELARLSGITKAAISSYLSGKYEPRRLQVHQLAEALNVNELWLLGFEGATMEGLLLENSLTEEESQLINAYRKHQELHSAIKRLLEFD